MKHPKPIVRKPEATSPTEGESPVRSEPTDSPTHLPVDVVVATSKPIPARKPANNVVKRDDVPYTGPRIKPEPIPQPKVTTPLNFNAPAKKHVFSWERKEQEAK